MKFLKYFFLLFLILFVMGAIYLATLDGSYDVKRSRLIKAQPEVVFNDIIDFNNWKHWEPWNARNQTVSEKSSGEGASYSWTDNDGTGTIKTTHLEKPKTIDQEIMFKTSFGDMKSRSYWTLESVKEGTQVTWGMKGEMSFLLRWLAPSMEDKLGPTEEIALQLMDKDLMKKIKVYNIESNGVVEYSGGYYLYVTTSCKISEISEQYPLLLLKIYGFNKANNVRTTGGPFTLYHKFDEENDAVMFSVCYPVAEKMITTAGSGVLTGFLKHGTYYKTTLKGSYEYSDKAWKAATEGSEYLTGYKVVENGEPFEIYGNNPHETPNPADLITEIYIPVEKAEVVDQLPEPVPADSISE